MTWLRLPGMLGTAATFTGIDPWLDLPGTTVDVAIDAETLDSGAAQLLDVAAAQSGPVGVVALSLGAIVAMAAAGCQPAAFRAMVLMSTNGSAPRPDQHEAWSRQGARTEAGEYEGVVAESVPALFGTDVVAEPLSTCVLAMASAVGPETFLRQLAMQRSRRDLRAGLTAVGVPALIVAGAEDRLCAVERHREIAAALPESTLVVLPGAGHLLPLEHPQLTAAVINTWWRSVAPRVATAIPPSHTSVRRPPQERTA